MESQKLSFKFRFDGERWRDIKNRETKVLSDVLDELNIIIDDNCEYARIKDYFNNNYIIYHASAGLVQIDVWDLNTH